MVPAQKEGIKISKTVCGPNTGDKVVVDETGQRWLKVSEFSYFRGTGERRGILKYGAILEV